MGEGVKPTDWSTTSAERVYGSFLLRVCATPSPHRWRWFVVPLETFQRYGRSYFYASTGSPVSKGCEMSDAKGHAMTLERAMQASVAMADAIVKELAAEKKKKKR